MPVLQILAAGAAGGKAGEWGATAPGLEEPPQALRPGGGVLHLAPVPLPEICGPGGGHIMQPAGEIARQVVREIQAATGEKRRER